MPSSSIVATSDCQATDDADSHQVRLRDMITLIIGIGIIVAPWFNGDDLSTHGAIRLRIIAIAICALSLWLLDHQRHVLAEWANAALGVVLAVAPFWRGIIDAQSVGSTVAGVVIIACSASCALQSARNVASLSTWPPLVRASGTLHEFSRN